jgi:homoserine dehydrogenase
VHQLNIGLIGFGTIGCGVVKALQKNSGLIKKRTGLSLELKKIADIDLGRQRPVKVEGHLLTTDANEILEDREIDVVVELIGGYHPAREFIIKALRSGKYVVTANKALLARHGYEILSEARKNNVDVYFEASVGGGIPLLLPMGLSLGANSIRSIYGILNGTCNYVLTKMAREGKSFEAALREAQQKGFAEANPRLDISGVDSMHKLVILASLAFGCFFRENEVSVEGITKVTQDDIRHAKELGYSIKLLAIAQQKNGMVSLRVHPALVPREHLLGAVENEMNAVFLKGDIVGELLLYGKGAGMLPTASAVVADLINVAQDISNKAAGEIHLIEFMGGKRMKTIPSGGLDARYYLRFNAVDEPGVFAAISRELARNRVGIAAAIQKERRSGETAQIVLTTALAKEKSVMGAVERINKLNVIRGKATAIRIESMRD